MDQLLVALDVDSVRKARGSADHAEDSSSGVARELSHHRADCSGRSRHDHSLIGLQHGDVVVWGGPARLGTRTSPV